MIGWNQPTASLQKCVLIPRWALRKSSCLCGLVLQPIFASFWQLILFQFTSLSTEIIGWGCISNRNGYKIPITISNKERKEGGKEGEEVRKENCCNP
ncbi:hypothetical protein I7I53_12159 [Histoplasma capsulatum var. duboisii H88]|uniref:Uncharacterized protein n=1 Tax=Ajellomyces capsulatus (strain H88) TaxID=544711 RepID=A0A8A1M0A9_AJEC8|nr:hypothetical protein I7I53_12159 [Histoplasma capsulatum var. duboisii H88]